MSAEISTLGLSSQEEELEEEGCCCSESHNCIQNNDISQEMLVTIMVVDIEVVLVVRIE